MGTTPTVPHTPGLTDQQIQTRPPLVRFLLSQIPPTQFIYLQDNDFIILNTFISLGGSFQVRATYRYLATNGEVKEGTFITPALVTGYNQFSFQIGEGWLLSINLQQVNPVVSGFWCHSQIAILRSSLATTPSYGLIWQGFVFNTVPNGWPGQPSKEITEGPGFLRSITGSAPAAGADINEVVPTLRRWELLVLSASLNTSVAVANRVVGFQIDDGASILYAIRTGINQVASTTFRHNLSPSLPLFNDVTGNINVPAPSLNFLKTGWRIRTITANLQAADQWTAPQYAVFEWGTPDL